MDLHSKIAADVDEVAFDDETPVEVNLTIPMSAGLWTWVRAKADYEGLTHEQEVAELIFQERLRAIRHAELADEAELLTPPKIDHDSDLDDDLPF